LGQKLGITADEAAGFSHAAELSGVSSDGLAAAMQRLSRQGLDIYKVADQIASIQDPALRSKYAFEVLGKSGADLIPMLMGGSAELRKMVEEGAKLSGLEGLDTGKIEEANDAITRAKAGFQGIANIAAVTLAPAIEWMAIKLQEFSQWILSGGEYFTFLGAIGIQVANNIAVAWAGISSVFSSVWEFIGLGGQMTFESMLQFAFDFFAGCEYVATHAFDGFELAFNELALWGTVAFEELKYLFTVQIPAVLGWLASNWVEIFRTMYMFTVTVFGNMGKNVKMAMKEIWDFIKTGGKNAMEFAWTPLTEGFVSTVKELPDIPDRAITELEQSLAAESDRLGKTFADGMQDHIQKRRDELLGDTKSKPFELNGKLNVEMPEIDPEDMPDLDVDGLYGVDPKKKKKGKGVGELQGAGALQSGTSDAFSAIFNAMRQSSGGDKDPNVIATQNQTQVLVRELKNISKPLQMFQVATA
jgi:hypothetical protein